MGAAPPPAIGPAYQGVGRIGECWNGCNRTSVTSILDRYQRIAPLYDLLDFPFEHGRYRHIRPQLFQGLSGQI